MVIRGRTRGNGRQLADYLLTMKDNDDIFILDVVGRGRMNDKMFHQTMRSMSLTSELTKSDKGLYHAQINPAYGEDKNMTAERWLQAADLLGEELGLSEQRRVIVIHTKKGRSHGHVVWERFNHEKGIMVSDSFSRLAQDRARQSMEKLFAHKPTPVRNAKRPEMKQLLSGLWQKVKSGAQFIKEAKAKGFVIAAGVQRRPFMVVDETGRSFDLVRQLEGVKTREVRERLKGERLVAEKDAIETVRKQQKLFSKNSGDSLPGKEKSGDKEQTAQSFAENRQDATTNETHDFASRKENTATLFKESKDDIQTQTNKDKNEKMAQAFADNKASALKDDAPKKKNIQDKKNKFLDNFKDNKPPEKGKGLEYEE